MDQVENECTTALELVTYAQAQGFDLEPLRNDSLFQKNQRWVFFWRNINGLPCSGPANEKPGTLHYNMQGAIAMLPDRLIGSVKTFQGGWTEAGTVDGVAQAFELVRAWLVDAKAVDDLPQRSVRRSGVT